MLWLGGVLFVTSMWALVLWGSIKLLQRDNPKNTLGTALAMGLLFTLTHQFPLPGYLYLIAWLLLMARFVMWHYHLNILGTLLVTAATVFGPSFIVDQLINVIGDSETLAAVIFFGLPIATIGTWFYLRQQGKRAAAAEAPERGIPKAIARVTTPAEGAPVPVVTAPVKPVAPPRFEPTPLGDKPSLLTGRAAHVVAKPRSRIRAFVSTSRPRKLRNATSGGTELPTLMIESCNFFAVFLS